VAVSGLGSPVFGRLFDGCGIVVLVPLTVVSALFAPLMFLSGFWMVLAGAAVWGLGTGVHESIIPAAVAPMVAAERRASTYGLFTAAYGVFWFPGSAAIGVVYDVSRHANRRLLPRAADPGDPMVPGGLAAFGRAACGPSRPAREVGPGERLRITPCSPRMNDGNGPLATRFLCTLLVVCFCRAPHGSGLALS
jgi:hypothetical protein